VASYKSSQLNIKQFLDDLWSLILPTHPFNQVSLAAKTAAAAQHAADEGADTGAV
jgi:hypothetical protein